MTTDIPAAAEVELFFGASRHPGLLGLPDDCCRLVLFAHGSGSSRLSRRNNYVAESLRERGIGTLLFDLLTEEEDRVYARRFDIELLTERLLAATAWVDDQPEFRAMAIGYFGASTGAAAALKAAARLPERVGAVVSRGRPDLAGDALAFVRAPTLLIVGGNDEAVLELNEQAYAVLGAVRELSIVPGATHLFEETGALEQVAELAADWFCSHLA
ncbi:dienelactone hydrolase family protein [Marinobacterium aestuariivivens]